MYTENKPKLKKLGQFLGKSRIGMLRSMFILALQNATMIFYLVIVERGFDWWYLLYPLFYLGWVVFDMNVIWGQELNMNVTESEEMKLIKKQICVIERSLTGKITKMEK